MMRRASTKEPGASDACTERPIRITSHGDTVTKTLIAGHSEARPVLVWPGLSQ